MGGLVTLLDGIDRISADFAAAMQAAQLELYPAVAVAVIVAFMLSSRRDPDRL
jgi:hypothetical protein